MGSDWDASSDEEAQKPAAAAGAPALAPAVVVPVKKNRFADEDASDDDAKDDWDVSSDDEAPAKPAAPVGSMRNKGSTKQKIAQKEEEERKRLEALEEQERENDPATLRARARAAQLQSDMDAAASLFGATTVNDNPLDMNCRTKEDFSALASAVADNLIAKHGSSKLFPAFFDELAKLIAAPLKSDEVGKVRASLASLAIEKGKAEKANVKGPKGKPTAQMVARGREDLSQFGAALDDERATDGPVVTYDSEDDFM